MNYNDHYIEFRGPLAVIRACKYCGFKVRLDKGIRGVGRGYGMREGNKARGQIIQHLKKEHRDKLCNLINKAGELYFKKIMHFAIDK